MNRPFQVSLAPDYLWQKILPWNFYQQGAQIGLLNINFGQTASPETETAILERVGSYGKQIGRIGDALEVVMRHVDRATLSPAELDIFKILEGQLADIRQVKASKPVPLSQQS